MLDTGVIEAALAATDVQDLVVRVVITDVQGSAPRGVGTQMIVTPDKITGTIGGGALEWAAIQTARSLTAPKIEHHALGPDLGQCCGGRVTLAFLPCDPDQLKSIDADVALSRVTGMARPPASVTKAAASARNAAQRGKPVPTRLIDGWLIEPLRRPTSQIWVWGAGHIGREITDILAPMSDLVITWIDYDLACFPPDDRTMMGDGKMPARPVERGPSDAQGQAPRPMPAPDAMQSAGPDVGPHARPNAKPETATDAVTSAVTPSGPKPANTVIRLPAAKPELLVKHAPQNAHHIIATRSHQLDLALCDGVLRRGFGSAGVIGSKTKWARFRSRLRDAGHSNAEIDSIICPIGDPALGKHPRAIAVGVASALLQLTALQTAGGDVSG